MRVKRRQSEQRAHKGYSTRPPSTHRLMQLFATVVLDLTAILMTALLVLVPTYLMLECGLPVPKRDSERRRERTTRQAA